MAIERQMSPRIELVNIKHPDGDPRVFPPEFVDALKGDGWTVYVNSDGKGLGLKIPQAEYEKSGASFVDTKKIPQDTVILTLRYPPEDFVDLLEPGTVLISMAHFPTRIERSTFLHRREINAIALDQITDDKGKRLVENLQLVAKNGLEDAITAIREHSPGLLNEAYIEATIIGSGNIQSHFVNAATHQKDIKIIPRTIGREITSNPDLLKKVLQQTHLLVDATQRIDPKDPIVPNEMIALLPEDAVLLDLCVDPDLIGENGEIISQTGIQGIPKGDLVKDIFTVNDPRWNDIPPEIPHDVRRIVISCYSWPGRNPERSMQVYAEQLLPLLHALKEFGYDALSTESDNPYVRALARGSLKYFMEKEGLLI